MFRGTMVRILDDTRQLIRHLFPFYSTSVLYSCIFSSKVVQVVTLSRTRCEVPRNLNLMSSLRASHRLLGLYCSMHRT